MYQILGFMTRTLYCKTIRRESIDGFTFVKMLSVSTFDKPFVSYKWHRWSLTLWNPVGSFGREKGCDGVVQP